MHLTDAVGLDLRHDAQSPTDVLLASMLGLMRAQTLFSTGLCPAIYRFPETSEGQRAEAFLDDGGDAMDQDKMWQLMPYTCLALEASMGFRGNISVQPMV